jgi:hypothetical protein
LHGVAWDRLTDDVRERVSYKERRFSDCERSRCPRGGKGACPAATYLTPFTGYGAATLQHFKYRRDFHAFETAVITLTWACRRP